MGNNYLKLLAGDIKKLWDGLDLAQKFGMLALTIITIIAATFFMAKSLEPDWAVLYSDLSETDAISVVENLKKNGYQYKIADDKKTILVPSNVRDDMRIYVAENDLIKDSSPGFELLDELQMGSTDFKNRLTKQRIFQGELTRSIERMNGIKTCRVQIAEPERSIFQDKDESPSASVMLILEPGYRLKATQVKAIKNLVAYAIPRLSPEQVFITDQNGNSLSDDTTKNSNDMESFKTNLENQTATKITTVLEKIMGKGNVSVQVNADIDFNSAKATIESYIPINDRGEGVLTTSQSEVESYENPNQLPTQTGVTSAKNLNYAKEKNSTTYSVSKEIKQIIYAPGTVKRMTIAVAVNKVLTTKEKEEIQNLVLSASGANYERGDVITVSSLQFESLAKEIELKEAQAKDYERNALIDYITTKVAPLMIVFILGMTALMLIRGFLNRLPKPVAQDNYKKEHEMSLESQIAELQQQEPIEEKEPVRLQLDLDPKIERTKTELNDTIMSDPAEAARLLTSFIKE